MELVTGLGGSLIAAIVTFWLLLLVAPIAIWVHASRTSAAVRELVRFAREEGARTRESAAQAREVQLSAQIAKNASWNEEWKRRKVEAP
jgi:hypothetical protein